MNKKTIIHLDLDSVSISKNDLDKVIFGVFKYAINNNFKPPFIFTANVTIRNHFYLGVLKNNNVRLVDETPDDVDILISEGWKDHLDSITTIPNVPANSTEVSRACIYIDWDNIQVSPDYIDAMLDSIYRFIHNVKIHSVYEIYVFLHIGISDRIKQHFKSIGVQIINIIKDKSGSGDDEIFRFISQNTECEDSLCIVSGDRDFSPIMVEYVRNFHDVFLVYNKQAIYTFKNNKHWIGSIDIKALAGVETKVKPLIQNHAIVKTKPCRFYNLGMCDSIECSFLHICGVCGQSHRIKDAHAGITEMKNNICKKYNNGTCIFSNQTCDSLHICIKCKQSHPYNECKLMVMYCPLCMIHMNSVLEYLIHHTSKKHLRIMESVKKIITCDMLNINKHVLIL